MKIIVATHNEGKLAEIRRILEERLGADAADIELVSAGSLGLPDPVEDGVTFQENALIKARDVAERTGCPAVADDSGLIVDVMGNAQGHSVRTLGRRARQRQGQQRAAAQAAGRHPRQQAHRTVPLRRRAGRARRAQDGRCG